ncbi:MAG TPA: zf-HC2 domain-containing protein [Candidatus Obscuribacterales bacterium]
MVVSCSEFKEDLSSLVDGELEEHKQSLLCDHLSACAGCRDEHDRFKHVGSLLRKTAAQVANSAPNIWEEVAAKLPDVCQCVQEDLSAYLDGELIASAKEGVSIHLEKCSLCLRKFQQLTRVNGMLSKGLVLPESIQVDVWAAVKARLNEDCLLIQSELSAFIDREVATLRHRAITAHLTECAECTRHFHELSQTGDMLRSNYLPADAESVNLWPRIVGRLNVIKLEPKDKEKKRPQPAARRLSAIAAAVVAGVVASSGYLFYYQQQHTPHVQPVTAEAYLIDQSLGDPSDVAEAVVYERSE